MLLRALSDSAREIARMHAPRRADTTITATPGQAGACHRRKCGQQCRRRECAQARAGASPLAAHRTRALRSGVRRRSPACRHAHRTTREGAARRARQTAVPLPCISLSHSEGIVAPSAQRRLPLHTRVHQQQASRRTSWVLIVRAIFCPPLKWPRKTPKNPGSLGQPLSTRRCSSPSRGAPRGREGGWTGPRAQCAACVPSLLPSRR